MNKIAHPYSNISIAFTTMHEKEKILEPLFAKEFSAKIVVPHGIDTDRLGTFTGEIKREIELKSVLRQKAMIGIDQTGLTFGLASEGSFGPHPWIPFVSCNQESLIFIDLQRGLEIFSHFISTDNRAEYIHAENFEQVTEFLQKIQFGPQGVVLKPSHDYVDSTDYIFKGLQDIVDVKDAFQKIKANFDAKTVFVETDNRAFLSPKRRQVILLSGQNLILKLNSLCPDCYSPGFEMTDSIRGLVCTDCGLKSDKPAQEIWSCPNTSCSYQDIRARADGIKNISSAECDWCNP